MTQAAYIGIPTTKVLTPLGSQAAGSIVQLNFNGVLTEFVVIHQGLPSSAYDASCNGTWVMNRWWFEDATWNSSNAIVPYSQSTIHAYLNDTVYNRFDDVIKGKIKQVKIPYTSAPKTGTVSSGANGLSTKLFLLSGKEVNWTLSHQTYSPTEGAPLTAFVNDSTLYRMTPRGQTTIKNYWYRSTCYSEGSTMNVRIASNMGTSSMSGSPTQSYGIRFAMILPNDLGVYSNGVITGEPAGESETSIARQIKTGYIGIDGVARELLAGYIGVEGVARQFLSKAWTGALIDGTTISEFGLPTVDVASSMIRNDYNFRAYSSGYDPVYLSSNRVYFRAPYEQSVHYSFWSMPFNFSGVSGLAIYGTKNSKYSDSLEVLISPTLPVVGGNSQTFEDQLSGVLRLSGLSSSQVSASLDTSGIEGKQYIGLRINQWSSAYQMAWYVDKLTLS